MDSVSQIVLGASVSIAAMGRRTAAWKAALWGAIAGTLPDLDALVDHGDAILNMVLHRSESHSLVFLTLASVPMAWAAARLSRQREPFGRWWLALWLALITHPLLDWMTVYGTQLLLPFTAFPFAVGSVFIIDPLYTLPLLAGVAVALSLPGQRGVRWAQAGLVLSTAYLAWSVVAQQWATNRVMASLPVAGVQRQQLLVTPAPFNTLLWRAVVVTPTHYYEGYRSLLDGDRAVRWTSHERGRALMERHAAHPMVERVARFSHGFFKMSEHGGDVFITDLRMGYEPAYTFHFNLGTPAQMASGSHLTAQQWQRPDLATALPWLWQRMWGHDVDMP
jgi:inner membrane protein